MSGLPLRNVAQIAVVVRDIDEARKRWAKLLSMPEPPILTTDPGSSVNMSYRGQASDARTHLAFFQMENLQIELIQPLGPGSVWQEALDEKGEHVQHIAFWVEDYEGAKAHLAECGAAEVQRGDMGPGQYGYFDGQATLGLTVELLQRERGEG